MSLEIGMSADHNTNATQRPQQDVDPFNTQRPTTSEPTTLGGYQLLRPLGQGGMGIVYEAVSAQGGVPVALKTLQKYSDGALRQFKEEFRVLADLTHENLVRLGELVTTAEEPFFTMELIQGKPFDQYVQAGFDTGLASPNTPYSERRLRETLCQLANGLSTLHAANIIHRDLKPSNVLVEPSGRVVILDFGLATDAELASDPNQPVGVAGTPYFMAPEQFQGQSLTPACDWYAVGVMLYEALTGERAFTASNYDQLIRVKRMMANLSPQDVTPDLPADLIELCIGLTHSNPNNRFDVTKTLRVLDQNRVVSSDDSVWVGRSEELGQLRSIWQAVEEGQPQVVLVSGQSGLGKTSLVDRFLSQLRSQHPVVVLRGRCYENESVAYQGFDSIVDSLATHLKRLPPAEVERVLPLDIAPLCQVFPVLNDVPSIAQNVRSQRRRSVEGRERRRLALVALRELLERLARWSKLVIFIDDLQLGDSDTAALFCEITRADHSPAALFIGTYRSEDITTSECLKVVRRACRPPAEQLQLTEQVELVVSRFGYEESLRMAETYLKRGNAYSSALAQRIATEAEGGPLFIRMLSRHFIQDTNRHESGSSEQVKWSLASVIWRQVADLEPVSRHVLELLAAAGRPVEQHCLETVLADEHPPIDLIRTLRAKRLVRRIGNREWIETFHDKIRETVRDKMSAQRLRTGCVSLAKNLESSSNVEVEFLADLYRRGEDWKKSGQYYFEAAKEADAALAFERATDYYGYALKYLELDRDTECELCQRFAHALANASRASEAAEQFLRSAELADGEARGNLYQQAALRWLTSGHVEPGIRSLKIALASRRLPWPRTYVRTLAGLIWRLVSLRMGKLRPKNTAPRMNKTAQAQLDVCWSAAAGLSVVDPLRGSYFVTENLRRSLRYQDSPTLLRDLAMYIGHAAIGGSRSRRETARVLIASKQLMHERGSRDRYAGAVVRLARGISALLRGDWKQTVYSCDRAIASLSAEGIYGASWELSTARTFALWGIQYRGQIADLQRRQPELLRIAEETNDQFAILNYRSQVMAHLMLARNEPQEAIEQLDVDRARLSDNGFFIQHHNQLLARTFVLIYLRRGIEAWELIQGQWKRYRQAFLSQIQQVRVDHFQTLARAQLAAAAECRETDSARCRCLLEQAKQVIGRLEKEHVAWGSALATSFRGSIASLKDDQSGTVQHLQAAIQQFSKLGMSLFENSCKHHLATLTVQQLAPEEYWKAHRIVAPTKMAWAMIPGVRDSMSSGGNSKG